MSVSFGETVAQVSKDIYTNKRAITIWQNRNSSDPLSSVCYNGVATSCGAGEAMTGWVVSLMYKIGIPVIRFHQWSSVARSAQELPSSRHEGAT